MNDSIVRTDPAFCAEYQRKRPDFSRSERKLMLAVLEDAIRCYQGAGNARRERLAREARRWFFGVESRLEEMFTFERVCEGLSIDAEAFRDRLDAARRLKRRSRQPVNSSLLKIQQIRPRRTRKLARRSVAAALVEIPLAEPPGQDREIVDLPAAGPD